MLTSPLFKNGLHHDIQKTLLERLNEFAIQCPEEFRLGASAMGSAIESAVGKLLPDVLGDSLYGEYSVGTGQKDIADIRFLDPYGHDHVVDVKGQNLDKVFHRPNLISAERLREYLCQHGRRGHYNILLVRYRLEGDKVGIEDVLFHPITFIPWTELAIESQGRGVIQLRRGEDYRINPDQDRLAWTMELNRRHEIYWRELTVKAKRRADTIALERDMLQKTIPGTNPPLELPPLSEQTSLLCSGALGEVDR